MPIAPAKADATLIDLRYASVDDPRGPAARPVAQLAARARPGAAPTPVRHPPPGAKAAAWAAAALAVLAGSAPLGGCARDAEPATFAVPRAAAAEIRMVCPPGTFVGTMTINCPQPLPRAAR